MKSNPEVRKRVSEANIVAFVPCGGLKDTVNGENVDQFLNIFRELRVIIEGANVFFDDTSRERIAGETDILQIRDSSANKGGVTSSAIAEVLSAFLLGDSFERVLVDDAATRSDLIRSVLELIADNAVAETGAAGPKDMGAVMKALMPMSPAGPTEKPSARRSRKSWPNYKAYSPLSGCYACMFLIPSE